MGSFWTWSGVATGRVRVSFAPVSGLIPHLFGCCLKGGSTWEASIAEFLERQLASNGFLLDVVGSEGQVARGRGWASFGTGLFTACFSPV